jgi:hypothetical protein
MKVEKPTLILIVVCVAWFIALNTRMPIGVDTYNYLSFVFGQQDYLLNKNELVTTFFSLLPKSFLVWNALAVSCLFASCYLVGRIAKLFNPKYGQYGSLIVFNTILFPVFISQFEPLGLAMPFLLLATYLFFENKQTMSIKAWVCLVIGCLIWLGGGFVLIAFGLYKWPMLILGAIGVALNAQTVLAGVVPNFDVMENYPVY